MSYEYNYNSLQFPNGISLDNLTNDVRTQITDSILEYINYVNSIVTFFFHTALSSGDQTILDNIVLNSTSASNTIGSYNLSISINEDPYTDTINTLVSTIQGADYFNNITNIIVVSNIISGTGTYSIRLYDVNNRVEIAKKTFSNTNVTNNDLGTITLSSPITSSNILELHCKILSGTCSVNITNLSIYYNAN